MQVTKFKNDYVNGQVVNVKCLNELDKITRSSSWSPALFKDNYRNKDNFLSTTILTVDIDEGTTTNEIINVLEKLNCSYIVNFSRNHQRIKKSNPPCDRLRIIIPIKQVIEDEGTYNYIWEHLIKKTFPMLDKSCKDCSRYYYKSQGNDSKHGDSIVTKLDYLDIKYLIIKYNNSKNATAQIHTNFQKLPLREHTLTFLKSAHTGIPGGWNTQMNKAVFEMTRCGLDQEEIISKITKVAPLPLDLSDLKTINSAFNKGKKLGNFKAPNKTSSFLANAQLQLEELFDGRFHILEDDSGVRIILKEKENRTLKNVDIDMLLSEATKYFISKNIFNPPSRIKNAVTNYINNCIPLGYYPQSIALMEEDKFSYERLSFIPKVISTPLFDEFISRCGNGAALCAYIWSLFEAKSYRQQYLYLFGNGQDGKGSFTRFLEKILKSAYSSEVTTGIRTNKHYTASFPGTRLCVFSDAEDVTFISSEVFKILTGGDLVKIDPKMKKPYTTRIDTKFIILCNKRPRFSNSKSNFRRIILCKVSPTKNEFDSMYEEKLWNEKEGILYKCREAYQMLVEEHGIIKCDQTLAKEVASDFEYEYEFIFEELFELDKLSSILKKDFHIAFKCLDTRISYHDFLDFIKTRYNLLETRNNSEKKRVIEGIRLKVVPPGSSGYNSSENDKQTKL